MSLDITIRPGPEFARMVRALRRLDTPTLEREYQRAIQKAAEPLGEMVRAEIPRYMPRGYEAELAADLRIKARADGRNGVRITATARGKKQKRELGRLNAGALRHPVFGYVRFNRALGQHVSTPWVGQAIEPGFFVDPIRAGAPLIRAELVAVLQETVQKIAKG